MSDDHIQERDYSADDRKKMAAAGQAMPDGSFPIVDKVDLQAAIHLAGHAADPDAARRHVTKRAKALGLASMIPDSWSRSKVQQAEDGRTDEESFHLIEIDLAEPAVRPSVSDGRHIVDVTLIRQGKSANGNIYPQHCLESRSSNTRVLTSCKSSWRLNADFCSVRAREPRAIRATTDYWTGSLESALPLFEGARAFVDHNRNDQLPERSVRDLVGYYKNSTYAGEKIRSELHLVPGNEWLFNLLSEAQANPNLCGLSIDAWGDRDHKTGIINSIRKVDSIDIVTRPSAGGTVNHILQSDLSRFANVFSTFRQPAEAHPQG